MKRDASRIDEAVSPFGDYRRTRRQRFPVDSTVQIADRESLEALLRDRRGHPPLDPGQLEYAGRTVRIRGVGFYHEEGQIYYLEGLPGFWDEEFLRPELPSDTSQEPKD